MILITAAGGKTGRHVITALRDRGQSVRALARSERIHQLRGDGIETVAGDMLDPTVLQSALDGVRAVVHIGPTLHPQEAAMGRAVVEGARTAGVQRFIQMSVYHPQIEFLLNHQAKLRVENDVADSGLDYTILQPMHYMQNFDPVQIADVGVFRLPYSLASRLAFVDLNDVAEVTARVLTEDGHAHATYPLCGTDCLTGEEIVACISLAADAPVRGEEMSIAAFADTFSPHQSLPRHTIDGFYRLFTYYGLHGITGNANVLRWLLGREPGTFAEYVNRSLGAPGAPATRADR